MSSVINTNVASLNAQRNLASSQSGLATSLQRLSSGMRINSSKDDAAGMSISSRMSSQISGVQQAGRNANDGISLAQTAEGGLQNISDSLQRMRDLAVQSSNATNSASDRASIQNEVTALVAQINTVSSQSSFNGTKLLDGTFNAQSFQVGANAGESITIASIGNSSAAALGVGSTSSSAYQATVGGTAISGSLAANGITVNGYNVGPSYNDNVSTAGGNDSAIAKAAAFNLVSAQTGVTAKASSTMISGSAAAAGAIVSGSVFINNVDLGAVAAGTNAVSQANNVTAAINAISSKTGVTASFSTTTNSISLNAADGRNIAMSTTSAAGQTATGFSSASMGTAASIATIVGAAATTFSAMAAGDMTINGLDVGAVAAGTNATTQGANLGAAINALSSKTGVTASVSSSGAITLTATNAGQNISISGSSTNIANSTTTTKSGFTTAQMDSSTAVVTRGTVTLTSSSSSNSANSSITLGGSDVGRAGLVQGNTASALTGAGSGVASVDLSTVAGSQSAIATIDAALATLNTNRANLGAIQNRFSSVVNNLAATSENLSASRSRIQDADFAVETANLTHGQILQQAGTAMLSQANSLPQGVLALLK